MFHPDPMFHPDQYTRLFSLKESLFTSWYEVEERQRLELDGYPNVEILYIDGEMFIRTADLDEYALTNEEIRKAIALIKERCEAYVTFAKNLAKRQLPSGASLLPLFSRFTKVWGDLMRVIDIGVYLSFSFEERFLKDLISAGFQERDFDTLTHPLQPTFHQRRHRDLCLLKQGELSREVFKKRWAWSQMIIFQPKFVDEAFLEEQLAQIVDPVGELKTLEEKHAAAKEAFHNLVARLTPALQADAELAQQLMELRDYRFEMILRGAYALQPFLHALAEALNTTYERLIHLTPEEVEAGETARAAARLAGYAYTSEGCVTGAQLEALKKAFNPREEREEVRGKGVSAGIARGPARIVRSVKELGKVREGDVLVCDLTSPDYMVALRKVVAIVANIGGFTSHSAIVAREFSIPCVVGTGNATNVFKDGDLLEVDGAKGVVRRVVAGRSDVTENDV